MMSVSVVRAAALTPATRARGRSRRRFVLDLMRVGATGLVAGPAVARALEEERREGGGFVIDSIPPSDD